MEKLYRIKRTLDTPKGSKVEYWAPGSGWTKRGGKIYQLTALKAAIAFNQSGRFSSSATAKIEVEVFNVAAEGVISIAEVSNQ